jgi:hypothetical protein
MKKMQNSAFYDLFTAYPLASTLEILNQLIRVAMTTDNYFFEEFRQREDALCLQDLLTKCLQKEYQQFPHKQ